MLNSVSYRPQPPDHQCICNLRKVSVQFFVGFMLLPCNSKNCSEHSCVRTIQSIPHISSHRIGIHHHKAVHLQLWPERNLLWDVFFRFDFHTFIILLSAIQACPILTFMSFSLDCIHEPRYLKLSTCFNLFPPSA